MRWFRGVLLAVVVSAVVESEIVRGPTNIVGIHHENVTLDCHSDEGQEVKWTFSPFGRYDLVNISGHHGTSWSSRGRHSLTLERLTFSNAGKYVCRAVGPSSGGKDAAAAYVVVVADPPRCMPDFPVAHGDRVSMECSVIFIGQHNLTLEWLAPNGTVVHRERYRSGEEPEVARLRVSVEVQTVPRHGASVPGYRCRAYFSNGTSEFTDQASNAPEFRRNTCTVPPSSRTTPPVDSSTSAQPPSSGRIALVVVWVAVAIVAVLAFLAIVIWCCIKKWKLTSVFPRRRRKRDDPETRRNHEEMSMLDKCVGGEPSDDLSQANETGTQVADASLSPVSSQSRSESEQHRMVVPAPAQQHAAAAAAAASADAAADDHVSDPPPTTDGGNRPTSNDRQEPAAVQENPTDDDAAVVAAGAVSRQETVVNSPDSAAGPEYDLHADSSLVVSQPNDEPYAEDEVD